MSDEGFQFDRRFLRADYRRAWGSVWGVRKARRQLLRKWSRSGRASFVANYCATVARDGLYGAPWMP